MALNVGLDVGKNTGDSRGKLTNEKTCRYALNSWYPDRLFPAATLRDGEHWPSVSRNRKMKERTDGTINKWRN
jgi:hypothetical protein